MAMAALEVALDLLHVLQGNFCPCDEWAREQRGPSESAPPKSMKRSIVAHIFTYRHVRNVISIHIYSYIYIINSFSL
jgi:hypothetical protein